MKIIRNAEKKLLQEQIRQCDFTVRKCEENLNGLKLSLQSKVSIDMDMNNRILAFFSKTHSTLFDKSKNRQRQKFDRLQSIQITKSFSANGEDRGINQGKWVVVKEHLSRNSSAVHEHCQLTGHSVDSSKTKVLATESNTFKRRIKEAIEIKLRKPSLNRDNGFELARIYDTILAPSRPLYNPS